MLFNARFFLFEIIEFFGVLNSFQEVFLIDLVVKIKFKKQLKKWENLEPMCRKIGVANFLETFNLLFSIFWCHLFSLILSHKFIVDIMTLSHIVALDFISVFNFSMNIVSIESRILNPENHVILEGIFHWKKSFIRLTYFGLDSLIEFLEEKSLLHWNPFWCADWGMIKFSFASSTCRSYFQFATIFKMLNNLSSLSLCKFFIIEACIHVLIFFLFLINFELIISISFKLLVHMIINYINIFLFNFIRHGLNFDLANLGRDKYFLICFEEAWQVSGFLAKSDLENIVIRRSLLSLNCYRSEIRGFMKSFCLLDIVYVFHFVSLALNFYFERL